MTTFRGPPLETEPYRAETLGSFFSDVVAAHRERESVVSYDAEGRHAWTYDDLERAARLVGSSLIASGLRPGERVGVLMGNRPSWFASAFGVALAGGVLVPVNTYLERDELAYVLAHAELSGLLMQSELAGHDYLAKLSPLLDDGTLPDLRRVACVGLTERRGSIDPWASFLEGGNAVPAGELDERAAAVTPDEDGIIIYTSGTAAKPKGVVHAHRTPCLQSRRFVRHFCLDETTRAWTAMPLFWSAGFAMVMGGTLAAGGCVVLQEFFEPGEALGLLERERVTTPHGWPHQLAELEEHPRWAEADLSALKHIESFGPFGRHPSVRVPVDAWSSRSAYGLTETFTIITSVPSDEPAEIRDRTHGRLLPGTEIRILDPATGAPQPAGVDGEITVAGPAMMKGYLKVPPEDVFDVDGFFRTGDAGSVDADGFLHWTGRTSDLIKTGGANVSPVEIETELLRHPDLKLAAAVGVPHATLGQIVVVIAVVHEGATVDEDDVRTFLRGRIASYKIPRRVVFVREEELTLTGNAKPRPDELRALAASRLG